MGELEKAIERLVETGVNRGLSGVEVSVHLGPAEFQSIRQIVRDEIRLALLDMELVDP